MARKITQRSVRRRAKKTSKKTSKVPVCPRCGAPSVCAFCTSPRAIRRTIVLTQRRERDQSSAAKNELLTDLLDEFEADLFLLEEGQPRIFADSVWSIIRIVAAVRSAIEEGTELSAMLIQTAHSRPSERAKREVLPALIKLGQLPDYNVRLSRFHQDIKGIEGFGQAKSIENSKGFKDFEKATKHWSALKPFLDLDLPLMLATNRHLRPWFKLPENQEEALELCQEATWEVFFQEYNKRWPGRPGGKEAAPSLLGRLLVTSDAEAAGLELATRLLREIGRRCGFERSSDWDRSTRKLSKDAQGNP